MKIAQIAQINQLFQLLHSVYIYGHCFYELKGQCPDYAHARVSSVFSSKDNRTVILTRQDFFPDAPPTEIFVYCCGATVGSEQQHNQDFRGNI